MQKMHRNKTVMAHNFSMIPKSNIKRASFSRPSSLKTTFDAGYLVPIFWDEVLPGDSLKLKMTAFARLITPIAPIMDNLYMDTHFFFVPNRLIWSHWVNFMGEQANPSDSISYLIPTCTSPAGGYVAATLHDYFGLPTAGQITGSNTVTHNNLPLRAYNLIYQDWYRDENLQNAVELDTGDGPDTYSNYVLLRRGKRADYFTSCLPWPQKGGLAVSVPLAGTAPVHGIGISQGVANAQAGAVLAGSAGESIPATQYGWTTADVYFMEANNNVSGNSAAGTMYPSLYADLSAATGATINQLRLSIATQQMLELDARGGTRYTEIVRSHFGVISPDARLQRPEYLGGGTTPININPIAQTSATNVTGGSTPQGNLAAMGTVLARNNGFTYSATEHGYIIGIASVRADLTYQQGLDRMWSRSTRYDFYDPMFANLGEQAVLTQEIYALGTSSDTTVFGYQEHWAEYRYKRSLITGLFRSTYAQPLDYWHLSQHFTSAPTLNTTFIQETPPIARITAVSTTTGQNLLFDGFFDYHCARPMPLYSVPGLHKL